MAIHGEFDHQLKIGSTTENFKLVRNPDGSAMYTIENFVPQYRDPLTFIQKDWKGGHGQYDMRVPDKYFEGQAIDTTQDGRFFLGPAITTVLESDDTALDSAPVKFVWFPKVSKWICATSGKIYIYGTKWTAATTTVAGVTDLCVFGDYLFAACGASTAYKYSQDGDNWTTVTTLADLYATYFFVAPNSAGTAEVLWKAVTNELKSNDSGLLSGGQWSTAAYIGDTSTNITNVFLVNDNLLIGKTDGLWYYDSDGGIHQLRPDLAKHISTDNFKYVTEWSAGVYFSEINGMGEITARDAYDSMGPLKDIGNIGKRGDIVGLAADKDFLYVAVDEGTNTHIYKGREIYREGIGLRWEWCPWIYLGTYTTTTLATCCHTTTDRRLWFGYTTGATYATAYVILSDNPTANTASKFTTAGFLRMSYDYGTEAKWDKLWQSAVLEVRTIDASTGAVGATAGETVQVQYRKDTSTSVTECIPAFTTNGITETDFSSEIACNRIQFQINLASNTSTATPEVSYFQAKGVEKPTITRIHEAVYSIGDEPSVKAQTLKDLLKTARTSSALLRFSDLRYLGVGSQATGGTAGTDYVYCVMEPGYPQELEILHRDKGATPELGIRVRLREVSVVTSFPTITATEQYAVGDVLYASSTSQLSRLARGTRGLGAVSITVAASDAPAGALALADFLCDGTADEVQIQAAIDACPTSIGAEVVVIPGNYSLAAGITITLAGRVGQFRLSMYGAILTYAGSGSAITVNTNLLPTAIWERRRLIVEGGHLIGNSSAIAGIRLNDVNGAIIRDMYFQDWIKASIAQDGAISFAGATGGMSEANLVENIIFYNVARGVTLNSSVDNYSFGNNTFKDLHIELAPTVTGSIGMSLPTNGSLYRSLIERVGVWIGSNDSYGFDFRGNQDFTGTVMLTPMVELYGSPTGCYGIWLPADPVESPRIINDFLEASGEFVARISGAASWHARKEILMSSGPLTAGNANALAFYWRSPFPRDILIKKVTIEVTTAGGTAGSQLDVGLADNSAGLNRGTEFFDDLLLNSAQINDSWVVGDGGTQTKFVVCKEYSQVDNFIVGQILTQNAASLVGKYYIEYIER